MVINKKTLLKLNNFNVIFLTLLNSLVSINSLVQGVHVTYQNKMASCINSLLLTFLVICVSFAMVSGKKLNPKLEFVMFATKILRL